MHKGILNKIVIILILFTLLFSNFGFTLSAIATSEEFEVITKGFFQKDEIKFDAVFIDNSDKRVDEIISDVNEKVRLELTIKPQVDGFLKDGLIKAVSEDGSNLNFKISQIENNEVAVEKNDNTSNTEVNNDESIANEVVENTVENVVSNTVENTITNEVTSEITNEINNNTISTNTIDNQIDIDSVTNAGSKLQDTSKQVNNVVNEIAANTVTNSEVSMNTAIEANVNTTINASTNVVENVPQEDTNKEDVDTSLVDEEKIIQEKYNEKNNSEKSQINNEYQVVDDTSIKVSNIIDETKIVLELEFDKEDELTVNSLLQKIKLQFSGTFINKDLEEVKVALEEEKTIGWKYTKDIELTSEYTKFSPFVVSDVTGTIVENKISVKREITDKNYLPLKSNSIEITVPEVNGKKPMAVEVSAIKLMATRGEDSGEATFTSNNWNYDENSGIISILIENGQEGKAVYSNGIDELMIIYRFEDYIDETSNLSKKVNVNVEEYSAEVNKINKSINSNDEVNVDIGELFTYNIETNAEKINSALINANYNKSDSFYEAVYENNISLNILTSDLIEEIKINVDKDAYIDNLGNENEAQGIIYKNLIFNYSEVSEFLKNNGEIIVTDLNENILSYITKDNIFEDIEVNINLNNVNGIRIYLKNITVDKIINFKIKKAIQKCNYEKNKFNTFTSIESKISAEVKYSKLEDTFKFKEIKCRKEFEKSISKANIVMNKDSLSSLKKNENVELKIELNNNNENSDLYINPFFEIVFPKNVKNVDIEGINILYADGLKVKSYESYTEADIVKIKVELEGIQSNFCENDLSNGTNIIINTNIELDEYTSAKQDEIKLYYYNEGVSNYSSQTKWSISKVIPVETVKNTNGFDSCVFDYQVPNGLVAINTIKNYDGNLSEVKSVRQGEKTEKIEINSNEKIATMELLTLNNTGNICSDVVLLGRIPFKDNKDVVTNENLNTTVDTRLIDLISDDSRNANITEIYYSTNGEATKELDNIENGWTKEPSDITQIKSYLIVVKGNVKEGSVLRFKYDFNIPGLLPYDSLIEGSFGAFYNNNSDIAVVYESTIADKVGLTTDAGPKLEAKLDVDIGNGNDVKAGKRLKYTVTVNNVGSVEAKNVTLKGELPEYTTFVSQGNTQGGDFGFQDDSSNELNYNLEDILPGESKTYSYYLKAGKLPTLDSYAQMDNDGYFILENDEKKYITSVPDIIIKNKVTVKTDMLENEFETNEVNNKIVKSYFETRLNLDYNRDLISGQETNFNFFFSNISNENLTNVVAIFNLKDIYTYSSSLINLVENNEQVEYKKEENKVYFYLGNMEIDSFQEINVKVISNVIKEAFKEDECYFEIYADGVNIEESTKIPQKIVRELIEVSDISVSLKDRIKENEELIVSAKIVNTGSIEAENVKLKCLLSDSVSIVNIVASTGKNLSIATNENGEIVTIIPSINPSDSMTIDIKIKINNSAGTQDFEGYIRRIFENVNQDPIEIKQINFIIENTEKTEEEIEADRIAELEKNSNNNDVNIDNNSNNNTSNENNSNNENNSENSNNNSTTVTDNSSDKQDENQSINNSNTEEKNPSSVAINESNSEDSTSNSTELIKRYSISGITWMDTNENGIREENEKLIGNIQVYLLTSQGIMKKSTVTNGSGMYKFDDLDEGKYVVALTYDSSTYINTTYKSSSASEITNSDFSKITNSDFSATSDELVLNNNIENIDCGLIERKKFDLSVNKYISSINLITKDETKKYNYDNSELEKIEIQSRKINGSKVELEYNIIVENVGSISGSPTEIEDFIPQDTIFEQDKNPDWYQGIDGNIYAKNISNNILDSGDKIELKLILTKEITPENMGTISNKVVLLNSSNVMNLSDNVDNNVSTQNVLVLVSTGELIRFISYVLFIIVIIIVFFNFYDFKHRYKDNSKNTIVLKKRYR